MPFGIVREDCMIEKDGENFMSFLLKKDAEKLDLKNDVQILHTLSSLSVTQKETLKCRIRELIIEVGTTKGFCYYNWPPLLYEYIQNRIRKEFNVEISRQQISNLKRLEMDRYIANLKRLEEEKQANKKSKSLRELMNENMIEKWSLYWGNSSEYIESLPSVINDDAFFNPFVDYSDDIQKMRAEYLELEEQIHSLKQTKNEYLQNMKQIVFLVDYPNINTCFKKSKKNESGLRNIYSFIQNKIKHFCKDTPYKIHYFTNPNNPLHDHQNKHEIYHITTELKWDEKTRKEQYADIDTEMVAEGAALINDPDTKSKILKMILLTGDKDHKPLLTRIKAKMYEIEIWPVDEKSLAKELSEFGVIRSLI